MSSALKDLWVRAGVENPLFGWDELRRWPAEEPERFVRMGLLRETAPAEFVICDNCAEAHSAEVLWTLNVRSTSAMSPFIACPAEGVLDVAPERLRQWMVDLRGLANLLADSLQLSGAIEALPGGRQWALGRRHLAGRFREVFLVAANGPLDPRILSSPTAVVLVAHRWRGAESKVPVFALSAVASVAQNGLALDVAYIEDTLRTTHPTVKAKPVPGIRIPDGARWDELGLEVGDAAVVVSIRDSRVELSLEDCGLTDARQGEAAGDRALQTLRLLARHYGVFFAGEAGSRGDVGTPFRSQISHLRKRLQALFTIEGNPITYHAKARCYRCAFQVRLAADAGFPTPSGANWTDFHFHETRAGALLVSIGTREVFRAWDARRSEDSRSSVEVAEGRGQFAREYRMEDLHLADQTGRAAAEGQTLIEFLRHSGEFARRPDDMAVLRLRRALQTWADLDDDPFEYRTAAKRWIARFGCSSDRAH